MKLAKNNIVSAVLGGVVGALAACLFLGDEAPAPKPAEKAVVPPPKAAVPEVPGATERALRRRVKQLEGELASARAALPAPTNLPPPTAVQAVPKFTDFRPPNPREMMERLKKEDPKRYEQFQKRFAEMRTRRMERTKGRLDFLGSIDTSTMTKEEKANHEKLQQLLAERENLSDPADLTEEEMREQMRQRHDLDRAIREANRTERQTLLKQTASALGLEGEDAKVLTDTLEDVIRSTEQDRHGPPSPPPQQ